MRSWSIMLEGNKMGFRSRVNSGKIKEDLLLSERIYSCECGYIKVFFFLIIDINNTSNIYS